MYHFVLDYSPNWLSCHCFGYKRVTRAARKLVACVVRAKACRSDHARTVLFTRRPSAGRRHDLAFCGGTSPSRDLQGEEARLLACFGSFRQSGFAFGARQHRPRGEKLARWRRHCCRHPFGHAGLPRPDDPDEAARRLFVTDAFIKAGTSPIEVLQALGLDDMSRELSRRSTDALRTSARHGFAGTDSLGRTRPSFSRIRVCDIPSGRLELPAHSDTDRRTHRLSTRRYSEDSANRYVADDNPP